jgi:hypothetical protein
VTIRMNDPSTQRRSALLLVTIALVASTCGGGGGTPAKACTPGVSSACTCTSGGTGAQVCSADGSGYGACTCSPAGSAGASGSAGTLGSAGATSPGGSGGVSQGGSAGSQGAAGAGTAGAAGSGASGTSGSIPVDAGSPPVDASIPDGNVATPTDGGYTGRLVSVQIKDAIIAPGMADGSDWDGIGMVDPTVVQEVAAALMESDPAAAVIAALANPVLDSVDKPDPYGTAQLTAYGTTFAPVALVTRDNAIPNTFTPIWPSTWQYKNIPIDTDVRISVDLWDEDLVDDDPIGDPEINSNDLKTALAAQDKYEVRVGGQTDGQLLFIGISVVEQQGVQ